MPEKYEIDASRFRTALAVPDSVKAAPSGLISGIAASFSATPDLQGDVIRPGAFRKSLARHAAASTLPSMNWAHQQETIIGRWISIGESAAGLVVSGQINMRTQSGREAFDHIEAGDATGLSIGFSTPEAGRKYLGEGIFQITECELVEISVVGAAADPRARITGFKSIGSKAELIDQLHAVGLPKAAALAVAQKGWAGLAGADDDTEHQSRLEALVRQATAALRKGL